MAVTEIKIVNWS